MGVCLKGIRRYRREHTSNDTFDTSNEAARVSTFISLCSNSAGSPP
jgi:hypothetical protein